MSQDFTQEEIKLMKVSLNDRMAILESDLIKIPIYKELVGIRAILNKMDVQLYNVNVLQSKFNTETVIPYSHDGYNVNFPAVKKAEFVLDIYKKGMTTGEIADAIILIEPYLTRKMLVSNLSAVLGLNAKDGNKSLYRLPNEVGDWSYYLSKWKETEKAPELTSAFTDTDSLL